MISYDTIHGSVIFSNEYMTKIIGQAVTSCFGVVGMVPSGSKQRIFSKLSKNEPLDTGIRVMGNADSIAVELHIMVTYGMNINAIAASITEKVKYIVEETTGIKVEKVIVKVDGIKE
jgi:uncharacterized alkaline shock family protein YloU